MQKHTKNQKKTSFSIRQKLILSYTILLFICGVLYSLFYYWNSSRYLKNERMMLYTNSAAGICQNIESQLHGYSVFSMVVSSNQDIQHYLDAPPEDILEQRNIVSDRIIPLLESFQILNPSVHDLTLYTSNPGNQIRTDYIQYFAPGELEIDNFYRNKYPWEIVDDTLVQHTSIFCIYRAYAEPPVGFFEMVLDMPGIMQSALSNNEMNFQMNISTPNGTLVWSNAESPGNAPKADKMVPITRVAIENTPLTVDFSVPAEQFYAGISNSILRNILPLLLLCFVISGAFLFVYLRIITQNIQTLTGIINKIDQSNLDINIDMQQNDEVSVLADCLNKMLKRINLLISDIYEVKEAEKKAELDALRAQINPHFLYNTMDVINWMSISGETEKIRRVTGLISQYYRTMLNHGEFYTTLAEEFSNIRAYINIQLIMHAHSFDVMYDCDEKLLSNKVPNFILQPAVENAILHGIGSLTEKRGMLRIVLRESDGCIFVDICDNGMGLTKKQQQTLNEMLLSDTTTTGYGLHNVQKRIQFVFGDEYGITLSSEPGEGCITRFRLPFCTDETVML